MLGLYLQDSLVPHQGKNVAHPNHCHHSKIEADNYQKLELIFPLPLKLENKSLPQYLLVLA